MATTEKSKSSSAGSTTSVPTIDIFDVKRIRQIVELMKENDLTELNIQQGELKIQLQRGVHAAPVYVSAPPAPAPTIAHAPAPAAAAPTSAAPPVEDPNLFILKSPMVGTFYAAPDPTSAPFVKVGDSVSPEKTVCLIEAMKVFNEIQAETSGKIVAILAKPGQPVEFGTPLFKIDTKG